MGKSSFPEIRLWGKYVEATVDERIYYTSEEQISFNKSKKDRLWFAINNNPKVPL